MTQERTPVSPEAFAWVIPGDDNANDRGYLDAMAFEEGEFTKPLFDERALAAAHEAGKREGMEEAIRIIDALPRSLEPDWTGTIRDMFPKYLPARVHVPTVDEGVAAIRAKLEER
jgi:hypothetical protein